MGFRDELPPGWSVMTSRSKGLDYYFDKKSGRQYWVDKELPVGWSHIVEPDRRIAYFHITDEKGTKTYTKPAAASPPREVSPPRHEPPPSTQRRGSNSVLDLLSPMPRGDESTSPPQQRTDDGPSYGSSSHRRDDEWSRNGQTSAIKRDRSDDSEINPTYKRARNDGYGARDSGPKTDQQQAAEFYSSLQRASTGDRADSLLYHMRAMNNWIKSVLIREHCPNNCRVLDLACGKGGDMMKWAKQNVTSYMGVDIAQGSLEDAVGRVQKNRQLAQMDITLVQGDLGKVSLLADSLYSWNARQQWHMAVPVSAPHAFDMVSMQFAFHYMFCDRDSATKFFTSLRNMLPVGGTFIATTIDPDRMIQKLQASVGAVDEDGVTPAPIRIFDGKQREMCTIRMDPSTRARLLYGGAPSAEQARDYDDDEGYGLRYKFTLRDGEDEQAVDLPEYLIPNSLLHQLIASNGFELVLQENFQSFVTLHSQVPRHRELLSKMHVLNFNGSLSAAEWDIVSLYQVLAFRKVH
ncbi:mRNA cap guanine-N7 methyltransferase [Achlya hypogyna]|uniref:mRNA (guanine-N(7))-methyltransferase n=1 Tax=Achlya hypogyna TaxID=1202772 RepID=A0A1V9Z9C6_ACHHY|nr:mRNA cap guanine-N7 methyltransferase [Achlya hypogyna]